MISLLLSLVLFIKLSNGRNRAYIPVKIKKSGSDASSYCLNEYGTKLATVTDNYDYNQLKVAKLAAEIAESENLIIGLNDRGTENTFVWDDGTPCTNENNPNLCINAWAPNEPNNIHSGGEDCVEITSQNLFNDVPCSSITLRYFACNACKHCAGDEYCGYDNGSYGCSQCEAGYEGNGPQCVDINECNTENVCGDGTKCVNDPGGYHCIGIIKVSVIECNENETRQCDVNSDGNLDCQCTQNVVPFISNYPFNLLVIICLLSIINIGLMSFTFCCKKKAKTARYKRVIYANSDEFSEAESKAINI